MRIIVGVDEHSDAEELLTRVMQLSRATEAQVVLLNVVNSSPQDRGESGRYGSAPPLDIDSQAAQSFTRLASAYVWGSVSLLVEPRHGDEAVADCIARVCREHSADLVVVASRRAGSNELGSVARQLLRTSPCPVVVIRTGAEEVA